MIVSDGDEIECNLWGEQAKIHHNKLIYNNTYYFAGGVIRSQNQKFAKTKHQYVINFNQAKITPISEIEDKKEGGSYREYQANLNNNVYNNVTRVDQ